MKGYVIAVQQAGASVGILKKGNKVLLFSTEDKAREYAREEVEGNVFMMIGWNVSPCSNWTNEIKESGGIKQMG
tara:strand:- start:274 stop:495 length:222 start_codon:yes stop_codon:yes gene_type:complete